MIKAKSAVKWGGTVFVGVCLSVVGIQSCKDAIYLHAHEGEEANSFTKEQLVDLLKYYRIPKVRAKGKTFVVSKRTPFFGTTFGNCIPMLHTTFICVPIRSFEHYSPQEGSFGVNFAEESAFKHELLHKYHNSLSGKYLRNYVYPRMIVYQDFLISVIQGKNPEAQKIQGKWDLMPPNLESHLRENPHFVRDNLGECFCIFGEYFNNPRFPPKVKSKQMPKTHGLEVFHAYFGEVYAPFFAGDKDIATDDFKLVRITGFRSMPDLWVVHTAGLVNIVPFCYDCCEETIDRMLVGKTHAPPVEF